MGIELIIGVLLAVAAGLVALQFWLGSPENRTKQALAETPGRFLAGAQEGDVIKVLGRVGGVTQAVTAPLSKRPCVYWEVLVEIESNVNEKRSSDIL
ncbi:MAG: hypothetical protein KAI47_26075, partial [Deltaproteobacteria bacterium]|nr:hypothetical protein [Deltaproteobacteria bacterium]